MMSKILISTVGNPLTNPLHLVGSRSLWRFLRGARWESVIKYFADFVGRLMNRLSGPLWLTPSSGQTLPLLEFP